MELIGAIVAGVVTFALGFRFARLWAPSAPWAVLIGVVCAGFCTVAYFGAMLLVGQIVLRNMDPKNIGYWFRILLFTTPFVGAVGAFIGYRRSPDFQHD